MPEPIFDGLERNIQKDLHVDFEVEDQYLDVDEGLGSKHYVRRAILTTAIRDSSRFGFSRFYIQHLVAFNAVFQKTHFAKYVSGLQGLSFGYATQEGHAAEIGAEFSAVSNLYVGYRYLVRQEGFSLWPFLGAGGGSEVKMISLSDGPPEAEAYDGRREFVYLTLGLLVPLVDVGLRAEVRASFYGFDRLTLTNGVGVIVFL